MKIHKNRFEQELVYCVEKYDISEEKSIVYARISTIPQTIVKEGNGKS